MRKTKIWIKNNLLFCISMITLLISIGFSVSIISINRATSQGNATRVGHIYLGSDENRYGSILSSSINQYKDVATYEVSYQNLTYELDFDLVIFQDNETLNQMNVGDNNLAFFNINKTSLENDLIHLFGDDFINLIDMDAFTEDLESNLSNLIYFQEFKLSTYLNQSSKTTVIKEDTFSNVQQAISSQLDDQVIFTIGPNEMFSILENTSDMGLSEETLSFMSQAILNVTLESPFNHYQFMGRYTNDYEMIILRNNDLDFSFYNPYDQAFQIVFTKNNNDIHIELIGPPLINTYRVETISTTLPYEIIYEDDETLTDSAYMIEDTDTYTLYQKTEINGLDGELNQVIRHTEDQDGEITSETLYYYRIQPTNQVIIENTVQKAGD